MERESGFFWGWFFFACVFRLSTFVSEFLSAFSHVSGMEVSFFLFIFTIVWSNNVTYHLYESVSKHRRPQGKRQGLQRFKNANKAVNKIQNNKQARSKRAGKKDTDTSARKLYGELKMHCDNAPGQSYCDTRH